MKSNSDENRSQQIADELARRGALRDAFERIGRLIVEQFEGQSQDPVQAAIDDLRPGGWTADLLTVLSPDTDFNQPESKAALEHLARELIVLWKFYGNDWEITRQNQALRDWARDWEVSLDEAKTIVYIEAMILLRGISQKAQYYRVGKMGIKGAADEEIRREWIKGPDGKKELIEPFGLTGPFGIDVALSWFVGKLPGVARAVLLDEELPLNELYMKSQEEHMDLASLPDSTIHKLQTPFYVLTEEAPAWAEHVAPRAKEIIRLFQEGYNRDEIVELLKITRGTLRVQIHNLHIAYLEHT